MIDDPSHPLFGVSLKINRAGDQLKALDASIKEFLDSKPYELETHIDPHAEHVLQLMRIKLDCPPMWSAMIGETIHNLRCALDYLVFQLVILETGAEPSEDTKIQFPIFLKENGFNSRGVPTMLQGVGVKAQTLIKSMQPFSTGEATESPLWVLSLLSNWDKHRSIHVTSASTPKISASAQIGQVAGVMVCPGPLKDNAPICGAVVAPGPEPFMERAAKVKVHSEVTVYIALEKPISLPAVQVQKVIDIIGARVFEIAKRINAEIF